MKNRICGIRSRFWTWPNRRARGFIIYVDWKSSTKCLGAYGLPVFGDVERSLDGVRGWTVGKAIGSVTEIGDFAFYGLNLGYGGSDDSGGNVNEAGWAQARLLCGVWVRLTWIVLGDTGGFEREFRIVFIERVSAWS